MDFLPEKPEKEDIPPEDLQVMVRLYQQCPKLWGAFKDVCRVVHLLGSSPQGGKFPIAAGLLTLSKHITFYDGDEDGSSLLHFISVSGYMEKATLFARQILKEKNKTYVTEFPSLIGDDVDVDTKCLYFIRDHLLNGTADSSEFCLRLAKTGYLQDLVEDVRHIQHLSVEALERGQVYLLSLGTIHNCCMFPESAAEVRRLDVAPHLTPFLKKQGPNQLVRSVAIAVLASTVEDDQSDVLTLDGKLLQYFLNKVESALSRDSDRSSPWRVRELLFNLSLLARHDFNKRLMVAQGILTILQAVLEPSKRRSVGEKKSSVATIDRLIKDQINLAICQNHQELVKNLKDFPGSEDTKTAEQVHEILKKLEACRGEDVVDDHLAALPHVSELMADQGNILSILKVGPVEFVLEELKVFHEERPLSRPSGPADKASCRHLLLALAELSAQAGYRREIMARDGVGMLQPVLRRGRTEERAEAARVMLELASSAEHRVVMQINADLKTLVEGMNQSPESKELSQLAENLLLALQH